MLHLDPHIPVLSLQSGYDCPMAPKRDPLLPQYNWILAEYIYLAGVLAMQRNMDS
jgi:hypothetical protein